MQSASVEARNRNRGWNGTHFEQAADDGSITPQTRVANTSVHSRRCQKFSETSRASSEVSMLPQDPCSMHVDGPTAAPPPAELASLSRFGTVHLNTIILQTGVHSKHALKTVGSISTHMSSTATSVSVDTLLQARYLSSDRGSNPVYKILRMTHLVCWDSRVD